MITVREIAQEAGVSPQSVSSVLSGKGKERRIAEATQKRIIEIAQSLGYQHNALASSLRAGKSKLLGIIGHSQPSYRMIRTRAAARVLIDAGYKINQQDLAWRPQQEVQLLHDLLSQRIDGLLIESGAGNESLTDPSYEILLSEAKRGLPMVRLDHAKGLPVDVVTTDRKYGTYLAMSYLLSSGHENIAFIIDREDTSPFIQARLKGFRRAISEARKIKPRVTYINPVPWVGSNSSEYAGGFGCMESLLEMQQRPTAVLAVSDLVAMGVVNAALQAGLSVPADIAVVGFGNHKEAELCAIPLTTVAFPHEQMGAEAARMLLERIDGFKGEPRLLDLSPRLIIRQTSADAATGAKPSRPGVNSQHLTIPSQSKEIPALAHT